MSERQAVISINRRSSILLEYSVVAFFVFSLIWFRSFNLFGLVIAGVSLCAIYKHRKCLPKMDKNIRWLSYLLLANFLLPLLYVALGRESLEVLKDPVRFLMMVPIILAISLIGLRTIKLYSGVAIGLLLVLGLVVYKIEIQGLGRGGLFYNPNPFGEVVMVSSMLLFCVIGSVSGWLRFFVLVTAVAGLYIVLLTETRGTILGLFPIAVIAFVAFLRSKKFEGFAAKGANRKVFLVIGVFLLVVVSGFLFKFGNELTHRFELAAKELVEHKKDRSNGTSIGIRLELWYSSWLSFKEAPLTGIGSDNRAEYLKDLEARNVIYLDSYPWRHNHNDYLDSLQRFGLPAMLIIMGIYWQLLRLYWSNLRSHEPEHFYLALGGVLIVTGYATFSLTEVPLRNSLTVIYFVVLNGVLIGILENKRLKHTAIV